MCPFLAIIIFELGKIASSTKWLWLYPNSNLVCVAAIGVCGFRCVTSVAHLFYMLLGGYMDKEIQERVFDVTGVELTPGESTVCFGNGERGFECCCDECDYYLLCFPEYDPESNGELL